MRRLILSSAFAALTLAACGRGDAPEAEQAAVEPAVSAEAIENANFPQEYSDISVDQAVRYGELPNGLRYAILDNDTPSSTAALRLRFDVGSLMERDDQQGLAHFLEHMAFNGSENVPEGEMVRILERHGLAFGADTNAYTSFGETVYMLDLPGVDEETMDTGFMLMGELDALTIAPEAVERERGVVLSEMRGSNTPDLRAFKAQAAFLFPDALLTNRLPIGTQEVLQNADAALIRDLYERYYTPERAFFVAVGDFDVDEIEQRIVETFGDWEQPAEPGEDPDLGTIGEREPEAAFFHDPSIPTMVDINYITPAKNLPDLQATRRENLIRQLGAAILNRRFAALSRNPDAVFLQASTNFSEMEDTADIASVTIYSEPANWEEALRLAEQELRRALAHGFSQAELDEALANVRAGQENAAAQADTRQTPSLAGNVVDAFGSEMVFTHPRDSLERFNAYVEGLTVEEVEQVFNAQWEGAEPLIFVTSGEEVSTPETIMAAYEASATEEVEAPSDTAAAEFAYMDFGPAGEVAERTAAEDLGVVQIRFANNVMLNFKQTDFEQDAVRVSLRFGGGMLETPMDRPELQFVAGNILPEGGTGQHSLDELERLMAGKTVSIGFNAGTDAFAASARTTPEDLETQLQLWAAYITDAAFRPEAISQFRQLYAISYPTMGATPAAVIARDVAQIVRDGDPRFGYPPVDAVDALTPEDARAVMQDALSGGAIEIGIVGDITEEEATAMIARTFGALPERAPAPEPFEEARNVRFPSPAPDLITLRHNGEQDQAATLVYWPAADGRDVLLARKLSLLSEILQIRVTDEIREEAGATYSPSVGNSFSREFPGFGYIGLRLELETADVEEFFGVVDELAADFAGGNISQDEFDRALRPILEGIEENQEQNPYWMNVVAQAQTMPENLDRHRTQRADYESISLDDIKALAAQYLDPEKALRIQVLPPEVDAAAEAGLPGAAE